MLGEPEGQVRQRIVAGQPTWRNPTERREKRVWYSASIGNEPHIADVILDRAREMALAGKGTFHAETRRREEGARHTGSEPEGTG